MTITLILVLLGLMALLFLVRLAKGRSTAFNGMGEEHIRPVDVEAFRNLIDPAEEQFLRANLPHAEFKRLQRERLRAAVEYISQAARNAAILVHMGEAARRSSDPSVVEAGEKLVESAIRLRVYSFQAIAKLYCGIFFPGASISSMGLADSYDRMTGLGLLLGRLQSAPRRVAALS